jgi:hypothetical protein
MRIALEPFGRNLRARNLLIRGRNKSKIQMKVVTRRQRKNSREAGADDDVLMLAEPV